MAWTTPGTATAGQVLTAARWNTDVRDNTNELYNSVRRIAYTQRTSDYSVASTTIAGAADVFTGGGATGAALTWTAAGSTAYRIEFFTPRAQAATNAGAYTYAVLVDGSGNDLGRIADSPLSNGTQANSCVLHAVYYYTPAAGSVTINVRGVYVGAAGTFNANAGGAGVRVPMWLAVFGPPLA